MYRKIAIPVDLQHTGTLERAIDVGADLAKHYGAEICMVGVTEARPEPAARDFEEYSEFLATFASRQSAKHGIPFGSKAVTSKDGIASLTAAIDEAVTDLEADLVVMASHKPGLLEHIVASNAGYFASHSAISVMVVR